MWCGTFDTGFALPHVRIVALQNRCTMTCIFGENRLSSFGHAIWPAEGKCEWGSYSHHCERHRYWQAGDEHNHTKFCYQSYWNAIRARVNFGARTPSTVPVTGIFCVLPYEASEHLTLGLCRIPLNARPWVWCSECEMVMRTCRSRKSDIRI